jgi:DNA-binding response OmpR family regulator
MSSTRILVADDSATLRTQLRRALTEAGYDVAVASDGLEAVQLARREPPELAILDIEMPGLDGYGVCQELQRMGEPWSRLPIVFLTASQSHALEMLGDKLGAYLHKPVGTKQLLQTVARQLEQHVVGGHV